MKIMSYTQFLAEDWGSYPSSYEYNRDPEVHADAKEGRASIKALMKSKGYHADKKHETMFGFMDSYTKKDKRFIVSGNKERKDGQLQRIHNIMTADPKEDITTPNSGLSAYGSPTSSKTEVLSMASVTGVSHPNAEQHKKGIEHFIDYLSKNA